MIWKKDQFVLSDDRDNLDIDAIHGLLQTTYWAGSRTREQILKAFAHSHCFSLRKGDEHIGFVRVISDYTSTSWISDMVIKDTYRGQQLGFWMMQVVMEHPELSHTQFSLQTKDAHSFYEKLGFQRRETLMSTSVSYL